MSLPGQTNLGSLLAGDAASAQTQPPVAPVTGEGNGQVPPSVGADPNASNAPKTAEEVDLFWRNRVSQKDKAHAEAERALREELESLKRYQTAGATATSNGQQGTGQATGPNPEVERLQRELETERQARVVDQRKAKYPALASQVGNVDDVFRISDEATLAKLNALADDSGNEGTFIAPTSPSRAPAASPKPMAEKSKEELLADLKAISPAYEQLQREKNGR